MENFQTLDTEIYRCTAIIYSMYHRLGTLNFWIESGFYPIKIDPLHPHDYLVKVKMHAGQEYGYM